MNKTDDCWLWTGGLNSGGYGYFRGKDSRQMGAHVFAYELLVAQVPQDYYLDHRHTCPKNCVNPEHLRPVTNKQNQENRGAPATARSGVLGVHHYTDREGYRVVIRHNGKTHYGGGFKPDQLAEAEAAAIALRTRLFSHNDKDRECHDDVVPLKKKNA